MCSKTEEVWYNAGSLRDPTNPAEIEADPVRLRFAQPPPPEPEAGAFACNAEARIRRTHAGSKNRCMCTMK